MADISITGADFLDSGTSGNDVVTFDTTRIGAVNANVGNGGVDTAILNDSLSALSGAGLDFGVTTADTWTVTTGNTFDTSFQSLTTSDGVTLVAGTALSGVSGPAAVLTTTAAGAYSADVLSAANYVWTGTTLTMTPAANVYKIVSVDGTAVTTGTTLTSSDGKGSITVVDADEDLSGTSDIQFTPNTAALAGSSNVGDQLTFTYPVVLEDASGGQITVAQSFTLTVGFTAANDTLDLSDTSSSTAAAALGAIIDGASLTLEDGTVIAATSSLGDDKFQGTNFDDIIQGGAGNDTIKGGNGDDTITDTSTVAGETNILGGGAGKDIITASATGDKLIGAGGADTLTGGVGDDALQGGGGDDIIIGTGGNNIIRGGGGDDTITGGTGNDEIRGGDGKDSVVVTGGNNTVHTSKGTGDTIDLTGGLLDTIVFKNGTETTTVLGFGAGAGDSVDVSALGYTNFAQVLSNSYQTDVSGGGSDTTVILSADSALELTGVTLSTLVAGNFDFA